MKSFGQGGPGAVENRIVGYFPLSSIRGSSSLAPLHFRSSVFHRAGGFWLGKRFLGDRQPETGEKFVPRSAGKACFTEQITKFLWSVKANPARVGPLCNRCAEGVVPGRAGIDHTVDAPGAEATEHGCGSGGRFGIMMVGQTAVNQVKATRENLGKFADISLEESAVAHAGGARGAM